ncbi:MAG: S41 family peptidase [Dokdonella sp.]
MTALLLVGCNRSAVPIRVDARVDAPLSVADARAELDELYDRLRASHYDLYARRTRADYDARFASMRSALDRPLTRRDLQVRFQLFVAYGNVAHAHIDLPLDAYLAYRDAGGLKFPLSLRVHADAVFVTMNLSGVDAVSPGDRLTAVDGEPVDRWLARLERLISADNPYLAHTQLEDLLPALVWLDAGARARYTLEIVRTDGRSVRVVVPGVSTAEANDALARQPGSLSLDRTTREARMATADVAYLRPGPFYNPLDNADMWDTTAFFAFIDAAFARFVDAHAKALVIDVRDNPGGDNSFSDHMVSWFATAPYRFASSFRVKASDAAIAANRKRLNADPSAANAVSRQYDVAYASRTTGETFPFEIPMADPRPPPRFEGRVFLLINRHSYSNTVTVAALAQDYGFATILGEETSDLATTYGASETFTLSRSGIVVTFPKAYIVRLGGSTLARGVIPDRPIDTPVIEPADDPVLRQAIVIAGDATR